MAFTAQEKDRFRQRLARLANEEGLPIAYVKDQANAAFEALDAAFKSPAIQTALSAEIDTATAPFVFPNALKKKIFRVWKDLTRDVDNFGPPSPPVAGPPVR